MALSSDDLRRIAELSRLEWSAAETAHLQSQLNDVLELITRLQAVDTRGVEPMTHPRPMTLRLREDAATEADRRADYQALAPRVEHGLYLVPRVVE